MKLIFAVAVITLTGCVSDGAEKLPELPKTNTVVIERTKEYPAWAVEKVPIYQPANGRVEEQLKAKDARGAMLEYVNCRSELLRRHGIGEDVNPEECKHPGLGD